MAVLEALAKGFAGRGTCILAGQRVEQAVHCRFFRLVPHRGAAAFLFEANGFFRQVAGNLFDVTADIADFRKLGCLDLDEWRIGQLGKAATDLGLAASGRPDHQDILRADLVAQLRCELLAAPAIAQGHGHGTLGIILSDDMGIQGSNNGLGSKILVHFGPVTGLNRVSRPSAGHWCRRKSRRQPPWPCARVFRHPSHNP